MGGDFLKGFNRIFFKLGRSFKILKSFTKCNRRDFHNFRFMICELALILDLYKKKNKDDNIHKLQSIGKYKNVKNLSTYNIKYYDFLFVS